MYAVIRVDQDTNIRSQVAAFTSGDKALEYRATRKAAEKVGDGNWYLIEKI